MSVIVCASGAMHGDHRSRPIADVEVGKVLFATIGGGSETRTQKPVECQSVSGAMVSEARESTLDSGKYPLMGAGLTSRVSLDARQKSRGGSWGSRFGRLIRDRSAVTGISSFGNKRRSRSIAQSHSKLYEKIIRTCPACTTVNFSEAKDGEHRQ